MARLPRLTLPGYPHHIIQRGNNRQPIFASTADYQVLLDLLETTDFYIRCGYSRRVSRCIGIGSILVYKIWVSCCMRIYRVLQQLYIRCNAAYAGTTRSSC